MQLLFLLVAAACCHVLLLSLQRFMLTLHFSAHRPLFKSGRGPQQHTHIHTGRCGHCCSINYTPQEQQQQQQRPHNSSGSFEPILHSPAWPYLSCWRLLVNLAYTPRAAPSSCCSERRESCPITQHNDTNPLLCLCQSWPVLCRAVLCCVQMLSTWSLPTCWPRCTVCPRGRTACTTW